MEVKLISYSQPVAELVDQGITDAQELIAFCARVSNPSNQFNTETSGKLIKYLMKHKHWSPLECVNACVEISTTRDIGRQILRHRSFSFQEFSQRYSDPVKELSFTYREARLQDNKNRQNSIHLDLENADHRELAKEWLFRQQEVIRLCKSTYEWAVNNGIAKEVARAVLPEGLTDSKLYLNGTLRSFIHFIEVRTDVSTQLEHRLVARAVAEAISVIFPMVENFVDNS